MQLRSSLPRTTTSICHEPVTNTIDMRVGMGLIKRQIGRRVKPAQGLGGKVWSSDKSAVINNYRRWSGRLPDPASDRLHSTVGTLLKSDIHILGGMSLGLDAADASVLQRFAELVLVAVDQANVYAGARRELTKQRHTEDILRQSESHYRSLLESSHDPIVVYDMEGCATYVNPAFEQTFKFSRDELLGRRIDFVPEKNWPETKAAIKHLLEGKKIHLFETQRLTKDKQLLDIQISSTLHIDQSGQPVNSIVTLRDITALKRAERELQQYHDQLSELEQYNRSLALEVEERKRAETSLRKWGKELQAQSYQLTKVNTALKVLLKQRDKDRKKLEATVLTNVRQLVSPYLERLKSGKLNTDQRTQLGILETNLDNIISPFIRHLSTGNLTPMEIRVANLVKEGKTNQKIADLLCVAKNTILFHRYNIRTKLGIKNKKVNLRSYLLSLEE